MEKNHQRLKPPPELKYKKALLAMKKRLKLLISYSVVITIIAVVLAGLNFSGSKKSASISPNELTQTLSDIQEKLDMLQATVESSQNSDLTSLMEEIRDELVYSRADSRDSATLGLTDTSEDLLSLYQDANLKPASALGYITISSPQWETRPIHQSKSLSSSIAGYLNYGQNYPFSQKDSGWYLVELEDSTSGWIKAQFVTETSGP